MPSLRLERYDDGRDRERWEAFVGASRNGTVFHTRRFLDYHPRDRFEDHSLLIEGGGGRVIAVIPACMVGGADGRRVLASHQGATYGGLVIPYEFGVGRALDAVGLVVDYARGAGAGDIWMRLPEYVFEREPSGELRYALHRHGFGIGAYELSTCYRLPGEAPAGALRKAASMAARRGLVCRVDGGDPAPLHEILVANLRARHGASPTHTLDELRRLQASLGREVFLVEALYEGMTVGGLLIFRCNPVAAHVFYSAARRDVGGPALFITEALLHAAMTMLSAEGYRYLNYGVSTLRGGREANLGLFWFKERMGGFGVVRETWGAGLD